MRSAVLHQERMSAGQLCYLLSGLMHVSSRTAIYRQSTVVDNATAYSRDDLTWIAQQELTFSIHHTIRSLTRLVFITSHLVYYSTMTSLDL